MWFIGILSESVQRFTRCRPKNTKNSYFTKRMGVSWLRHDVRAKLRSDDVWAEPISLLSSVLMWGILSYFCQCQWIPPTGICNMSNAYCQYLKAKRYCCQPSTISTVDLSGGCFCPNNTNPNVITPCSYCDFVVEESQDITQQVEPGKIQIVCYKLFGCNGTILTKRGLA
jgi:hypothetical protein